MSARLTLAALAAALALIGCEPDPALTSAPSAGSEPDPVGALLPLDLARLDTPPVDDVGFSMHRLGGDNPAGALVEGGVPYVDAVLIAGVLGAPRLAGVTGSGVQERGGRLYAAPDVVRREADALVWHRPGDDYVRVFPAGVLIGVVADSDLGRAAQAAGFEVFTEGPY